MEFVKKQMAYNHSTRREAVKYIVIHDTGNTDRGADALRNFQYFNTGDRGSSADFFVDDTRCVQANDYSKYYSWHCGDGRGKYGITNSNSVGLEICVNSDGDYNAAFNNAVEFTKQLMNTLGVPIDRVVRHYDASRKNCPASMSKNNWAMWTTFKQKLTESAAEPEHWAKPYYEKLHSLGYITDEAWKDFDGYLPAAYAVALLDKTTGGKWDSDEADPSVHWAQPNIISLCGKGVITDKSEWIGLVTSEAYLSKALCLALIDKITGGMKSAYVGRETDHWARNCLDSLCDKAIITTPTAWTDFEAPVTYGAYVTILCGALQI